MARHGRRGRTRALTPGQMAAAAALLCIVGMIATYSYMLGALDDLEDENDMLADRVEAALRRVGELRDQLDEADALRERAEQRADAAAAAAPVSRGGTSPKAKAVKKAAAAAAPAPVGGEPARTAPHGYRVVKFDRSGTPTRDALHPQYQEEWLGVLRDGEVARWFWEFIGGSFLKVQVRFADGRPGIFRPDTRDARENYRSYLGAYAVDRIMEFNRVPPAVGYEVDFDAFVDAISADIQDKIDSCNNKVPFLQPGASLTRSAVVQRIREYNKVKVDGRGKIMGSMNAWVEDMRLFPDPPRQCRMSVGRMDAQCCHPKGREGAWSDMTLYDTVIGNGDRYGENILTFPEQWGEVVLVDNGFSMGSTSGTGIMGQMCRFREETVERLRAMGPDAPHEEQLGARVAAFLADDVLAPVFTPGQLKSLDKRVAFVLSHVDSCISKHGDDAVWIRDDE